MIASFVFQNTTKVYFGEGVLSHLGEELKKHGKTVLLVYGGGSIRKNGLYDAVLSQIAVAGLQVVELSGIEPNPRVESVQKGAELCKTHGVDVVLAVGGGSTIDASKFIAASACSDASPWDLTPPANWPPPGAPGRITLPLATLAITTIPITTRVFM